MASTFQSMPRGNGCMTGGRTIVKSVGALLCALSICMSSAALAQSSAPVSIAAKLPSEIKIKKSNLSQFSKVGKLGKDVIYCHTKASPFRVGVGIKVSAKLTVWRSFDKLISTVKRDKKLKPKVRAKKIASLSKSGNKSLESCKNKFGEIETPTQTATPTLIATPFSTPIDSPSLTPSPTYSSTPSFSATTSPSASPSSTESSSPTPTESPSPSQSPSPTESASPSPTESITPSPTESASPSPSESPSESPSPSPTESASPSVSVTPSPSPTPFYEQLPVLINCGGPTYTDPSGAVWLADTYFSQHGFGGPISVETSISGTADSALYADARMGAFSYAIPLPADSYTITLRFAELSATAAGIRNFYSLVEENPLSDTPIDISGAAGGAFKSLTKSIDVPVVDGMLNISFQKIGAEWPIISAIEIRQHPHQGDLSLQVVTDIPDHLVDYDGNGSEQANLKGHDSKTFQADKQISSYQWEDNNTIIANSADTTATLSLGTHNISLTIGDNSTPALTATETKSVTVYPATQVGGVLARYYKLQSGTLDTLIDNLPASADFIEYRPEMSVVASADSVKVGGSPYDSNVVVAMDATFNGLAAGSYQFSVSGASLSRIFIDGAPASGPTALSAGVHNIEARFGIPSTGSLPAKLNYSLDGSPPQAIGPGDISHDQSSVAAFINSMPSTGSFQGGENITISGLGFFPAESLILHWGDTTLQPPSITISPDSISLLTPAGTANQQVSVWVEIAGAPARTSNTKQFSYTSTVPFIFDSAQIVASVSQLPNSAPTAMEWGPDGRLYVATSGGELIIYTLDDALSVVGQPVITRPLLASFPNDSILGLTFNPLDDPSGPVNVYISHAPLFGQGGGCLASSVFDYDGQVSIVSGPSFASAVPLITGLSVSNNSHSVAGLQFDNYGDLYLSVGGNTNAGVSDCALGELPENPLSGAILKANTSKSTFNGFLNYRRVDTDAVDNNQVNGEQVYLASGSDVSEFGVGLRNSFDFVWSTSGKLFSVTEAPQSGLGQKSDTAIYPQPDTNPAAENPSDFDRLDYVLEGHYYGHPNRSRGRFDVRQNSFRWRSDSVRLGDYTQPLTLFNIPSLADGIDEYRSTRFNNQLRGGLIIQRYDSMGPSNIYAAVPAADGTMTVSSIVAPSESGRAILSAPGGALISADYVNNKLRVLQPQDQSGATVQAFDIFPWRARSQGGSQFVIGGLNFGSIVANISVTIGDAAAQITSVSPTRIRGIIPPSPANTPLTASMLDVVVTRSDTAQSSTLNKAFRYLFSPGTGVGLWSSSTPLPTTLYEVSGAIINGVMYMVGGGRAAPYAYDFAQEKWFSTLGPNDSTLLADRPAIGNRHTAEAFDNKLYVFGGSGGASQNKTQIYDTLTNTWSFGPNIPFSTFSASSVVIDDIIYLAGGTITQNLTPTGTETLKFDPLAPPASAWTPLARMPRVVSAASAGTDGRKLYIFGGTSPSDSQNGGFNYVQIYDPATNTWQSSTDVGSTIPPLPQKRHGIGKAVWLGGEFYIMGGETGLTGQADSAGNVFARVDVYNPTTKTWRVDAPMRTARHGLTPLLYNGRIYAAGGSNHSGPAPVKTMDEFRR